MLDTSELSFRRATAADLAALLKLLTEDELGKMRESLEAAVITRYKTAFQKINDDPHHYLMVVEFENELIGTAHLTLLPSLTFQGSTRLQVESVHVAEAFRGQGIGTKMFEHIFNYAQEQEATIIQLTTNKKRTRAKKFYESLGFQATHEGMKFSP